MVTWVAYCPTCKEELAQAPNGALMEAVANRHADETGTSGSSWGRSKV